MADNNEFSQKQKEQLGFYEYKGYALPEDALPEVEPERELHEEPKTKATPLPNDIKELFNKLNTTGLAGHRDPLCVDLNYTKNKYRWTVAPEEKRIPNPPEQIQSAYQNWYLNDWKNRSRIHKIFSILWWLPSHFYRKYLASVNYKFYYNGLLSFLGRAREKISKT